MIKLNKGETPKALQSTTLKAKLTALKRDVDAHRADYLSGKKQLRLDIQEYQEVKQDIARDQHNKCCYCESKVFGSSSYGDVEHFRPKGRAQQDATTIHPTGYYWLICEWSNLYLSCSVCNTSHKRVHFPLVDDSKRARHHNDPLEHEEALLVDPYQDQPEEHLAWNQEVLRGTDAKGLSSIDTYGLAREALEIKRGEHLRVLRQSFEFMSYMLEHEPLDDETKNHIDDFIEMYCPESAEYAAMCRAEIERLLEQTMSG